MTRHLICEATLDALVEVGYERVSTTLIAQKAKVSRGALTHQFSTRNDLFVAAYQHLVDIWGDGYPFGSQHNVQHLSVVEMIDALWDNIFATQRYIAALELMLAARQNSTLGIALRDVMAVWLDKRDTKAIALIGSTSGNGENDHLFVQLLLSVLRGIAVHKSFDRDESVALQLVEMWKTIARQTDLRAALPK